MKRLRFAWKWLKDAQGVATSLIEATATIAVGAVLASVAVGGAIDAINDSKVQAASADVGAIGQAIITFYKDNSFFPLFVNGKLTGPADPFYGFLVSENGTYPTDTSISPSGATWEIPGSPEQWTALGFFGHRPDFSAGGGPSSHSSIEGHLMRNRLNDPSSSNEAGGTCPADAANCYPLRGSYVGDPQRGWSGPYISSLPKTDPWGNKYMVNVRYLHSGYLKILPGASSSALPKVGVIVLSAGPNRNVETQVDQPFDSFKALGDDIVFRIR